MNASSSLPPSGCPSLPVGSCTGIGVSPDAPSGVEKRVGELLRVEDVEELTIGEFYDVPAVKWSADMDRGRSRSTSAPYWFPGIIPIMGPAHNDAEFIHFPEDHWHCDWRFVDERRWRRAVFYSIGEPEYGRALGKPISVKNTTGEILRVRRQCRRAHPIFPGFAQWLPALEAAYRDQNARCGVCPHRGIRLAGAPVVNGARVCPGHGLAFNVETGALQPRTDRKKEDFV